MDRLRSIEWGLVGPVAFGLAGIVLAVVMVQTGWGSLDYQVDLNRLATTLGSLLVVALFLERALAVINNLLFDMDEIEDQVALTRQRILAEESVVASSQTGLVSAAASNVTKLIGLLESEETIRQERADKRQRLRLGLGFLVAILVAGVGVRSLGELVTPPQVQTEQGVRASVAEVPPPVPRNGRQVLFDWLDILLTAGLLAGGSNGIGKLIDDLRRPRTPPTARQSSKFDRLGLAPLG